MKTAETNRYIEYTLQNPELNAAPPFDEMVPYRNGGSNIRVVEQKVIRAKKPNTDPQRLKKAWNLSGDDIPLIQLLNPGIHRGQRVASMVVHVSRPVEGSESEYLISEKLVIRVQKPTEQQKAQTAQKAVSDPQIQATDHAFANGEWYKIPVTRNGIYALDYQYLDELGAAPGSLNPDDIEVWTSSGNKLPEVNDAERHYLQEVPIRIQGGNDDSFDEGDRILFYASSPHELIWQSAPSTYRHFLHPFSSRNYVYLNVAGSDGERLSVSNSGMNGSRTVREFRDIVWKEEERVKPSGDLKSGRDWYGQRFSNDFGSANITIFSDTLPGFNDSVPVTLRIRTLSRSTRSASFHFMLNGNDAGSTTLASIDAYNASTGLAARSNTYNTELTTQAEDDIFTVKATYAFSQAQSTGFLDWIELLVTRDLIAQNGRLAFFAPRDGENGEVVSYRLQGFDTEPMVLDVSEPTAPRLLSAESDGNAYTVDYYGEATHRFIAQTNFPTPPQGTAMPNQNIHGRSDIPDYLIVTSDQFMESARELAEYRRQHDGLTPLVVTQEQVFNEFSAGVPDISGMRDFVKYFYDRALTSGQEPPRYLLFFGNTSYDYKGIEEDARLLNHVITFQSSESLSRDYSYGSDDFFGLLDNDEGAWGRFDRSERIDIGLGRIPVVNPAQARMYVDKIKRYEQPENRGPWRNVFTFLADDGVAGNSNDKDLHLLNADGTAVRMDRNRAGIRFNKIYEFAYPVENTASGRRRPQATEALIQSINDGTLVTNYSGHGNEQTLSGERLFHSDMIPRLHNRNRPTIFVTATCSFGRYDDAEAQCGAEKLIFWEQGGAIAAFTTTRVVYTSPDPYSATNFSLNIKLSQEMIEKDDQGRPARLGDIYRETKNSSNGAAFNSRKFILLGDPAMRIGLPTQQAALTQINNIDIANSDTTIRIQALDEVKLSGTIRNEEGQPLTNYNGEVNLTVYDGIRHVRLPNEPWMPNCYLKQSPYYDGCRYEVQTDILFNGRASVTNGKFDSKFIVPKDINVSDNKGRVVLYAQSGEDDAGGATTQLTFDGVNENAPNDNKGPSMDVYLNSEKFVNGNLVGSSPRLIVELEDQSGINTTGTGVGHEIIAKINTDPTRTIVLNEFYTSELDDFTEGRVKYPIPNLPEGNYELTVQAWDVYNNPSREKISFQVADSDELEIENLANYPNPMNNFTRFVFEHNQAGNMMDVNIRIYTLSGRPVAELERSFVSTDSYAMIEWDGRGSDYDRLANGTYIYRVQIRAETPGGTETEEKMEKLVIIQ